MNLNKSPFNYLKSYFIQILTVIFCLNINIANAQSIPVSPVDFETERYRNAQLLGEVDSTISFTLRPFNVPSIADTAYKKSKIFQIKALPLNLTKQFNTQAPYGWNDGSMIPARGYQTFLSGGLYAKYGALSLHFKPEWVYADNPDFERFPNNETPTVRIIHILSYLNRADITYQYGDKPYNRLNLGQSSLRFNHKSISVGLSNENLWWGPGKRNALVMSNNANGFLHFTLNTTKPVKTRWGTVEGQLIAGRLESSPRTDQYTDFIVNGINYQDPKVQDWRYMSGITLNFQPKWVPGLFLGINRTFQVYRQDMGNGFSDYFPIISPFQKKNTNNEDLKRRDQLASLFLRYLMKESKSEFYMEYGWNDHKSGFWDLFSNPEHSRAYLAGFSKIFLLNKPESYLKINAEYTQMQQTEDRLIRLPGSWYLHHQVRHGYTHRGEVIGAGIGPGSNLQTIDISFWKKDRFWGIQIERLAHNKDFFYDAYQEYNRKWVDMMLNTYASRDFKDLSLMAKLNIAYSRNYQWQLSNYMLNVQLQGTVKYRF